jgi:biotin carboxylase
VMTDKGLMRRRLQEAGSPQPPYVVIRRGDDLSAAFAIAGSPAVIKPVDSGGQRGLFLLDTEADLVMRLEETLAYSRVGRAILEQYVPGRELNVIAVAIGGKPRVLTVSDRLRPSGPGFGVGWAHLFPATLPPRVVTHAERVACEAVQALGLRDGIAFPQLLVTEDDVLVVEVAARIAAGQMADLVRHGIGVDLLELAFAQALGQTIAPEDIEKTPSKPLAIRFLTAAPGVLPTGRLMSIDGIDQVRAVPGILDAELYLQLGETIRPVQVDADRRGYIIATAESPERALAVADDASQLLRVEVE